MTVQSVPNREQGSTPGDSGPPSVQLEQTRMGEIVGSRGITVDISFNQNQGIQLGKAGISNASGHTPGKLQRFLKEHLRQLGVVQIMIGVKFIVYGTLGITALHYTIHKIGFFSFQIGFPIWAALSFIISGSVTVVSAKKQTKALLRGNLRANILSTIVSGTGILVLSNNLMKITFLKFEKEDLCSGITSVATGLVVVLMLLNCLQFSITLALCVLAYHVDGEKIDWLSALFSRKSASESPDEGLLPLPSLYQNLERKDTLLYYNT
ncbi:high affinity immunoglobulin epsilon receptor subunit beta-like [Canis lupus familiaris]|uniref:high affinity immunoglobulin epsilon receptor subunit beta-like n=1 Tax=Canis lupus familiaris TaxID=9615 RepID=UPI0018F4FFA5|nr:high affinity immunoglobulin epsilon receptor subunit beta-like [Canis lupus familiaris]